jgi:hypothetical protein
LRTGHSGVETVTRTGPAYVESESELFADIERKRATGDITAATADAFLELYEFATEIGDRVSIGQAKNANFQVKIEAHRGSYRNDPSVFTANLGGTLKVWPARMVLDHAPDFDAVGWDAADYYEFERAFQSLRGVPQDATTVPFERVGSDVDVAEFKSIVEQFVATCRNKAEET